MSEREVDIHFCSRATLLQSIIVAVRVIQHLCNISVDDQRQRIDLPACLISETASSIRPSAARSKAYHWMKVRNSVVQTEWRAETRALPL